MAQIKVCSVCGEKFDIDKEEWFKPSTRYIHEKCREVYEEKQAKKNEKICLYCNKKFNIKEPHYKVINRYAHEKCYLEHYNEEEELAKDEIWQYLTKVLKMDAKFTTVDRQRQEYIAKGCTNVGILNALKYYYEVVRGSVEKSQNRIGIVPYVYDEAQKYYRDLEKEKERVGKNVKKWLKKEVVELKITGNRKKKEKDYIDLDSIGGN